MPRFAGHPPLAAVEPAIQHDAGPDTGPDPDEDDMRMAARHAEPHLCPRAGVRVVLHHHRQPDEVLHPQPQRLLAPRQVRREPHAGALLVDEPGRPQANGLDPVTAQQLGDRPGDHLLGAGRAG
jgi:hypothetical protein